MTAKRKPAKRKPAEDAAVVLLDGVPLCAECHAVPPCREHQAGTFERARASVRAEAERLGLVVTESQP